MKMRYKFIHFEKKNNTKWLCRNNKSSGILGYVEFYPSWQQWLFIVSDKLHLFSADCLRDIVHFIGQLPKKENR